MTAVANYIPAPKSVELHLSPSPEFSRYSKKVKALGGRYNQCRGNAHRRFVTLPWTDEGRTLANELVFEFRTSPKTTLIVRGGDSFRGKHVHAWVIVHKIDAGDADACGSLLAKYEFAFLKAFPEAADPEPVKEPTLVDFGLEFAEGEAKAELAKRLREEALALNQRAFELECESGLRYVGRNQLDAQGQPIYISRNS
jgi:hypothetical protein